MQENQLISVIVPVYNVEKYLDKCIESIVSQSYTNLEIILVDDGSTDNSGEKCDIWAKKDDRISVIHKENGGLGNARNVGMCHANGEWIGFVDSDDFIEKNMYELLYSTCMENNADLGMVAICYFANGQYQAIHKHTGSVVTYQGIQWIDEYYGKNRAGNIIPSACCKLYKSELIINKRFSEGRYYEDLTIAAQVLNDARRIVYVDNALYIYRKDRVESITASPLDIKRVDDSIDLHLEEIMFLQSCGYEEIANNLLKQLYFTWVNQVGICTIKKTCSRDTLMYMKSREKQLYKIVQCQAGRKNFIYLVVHYMKCGYALLKKIERLLNKNSN